MSDSGPDVGFARSLLVCRIAGHEDTPRWAVLADGVVRRLADPSYEEALLQDVLRACSRHGEDLIGDPFPSGTRLLAPVDHQEVWGAGITYERSREARMDGAAAADVYDQVYSAERPEIFFKATPERVRGPDEAIGVRPDSVSTVPEPELALVFDNEVRLCGLTIGNDVSARDVEAVNPLYVPQSKIFSGSCALGPGILPVTSAASITNLGIRCEIHRGDHVLWAGVSSTARLRRSVEELADYLRRCGPFPNGVILLSGTALVPPDEISILPGDLVVIDIDGLGRLANPVVAAA